MRKLLTTTALALGLFASPANADVLNLPVGDSATGLLTSDHCSTACLPTGGNAGTITVLNVGGGTYDVTVNLGSNFGIAKTGFDVEAGFLLSGSPTITYSSVTSGFSVFGGTGPGSLTQSAQTITKEDGFGQSGIEYGLVCTVCGNGGSSPFTGTLEFTISGATQFQQFTSNDQLFTTLFVFDIINLTTKNTGLVDASSLTVNQQCTGGTCPVPGPVLGAGLPGLIAACAGLVAFARRRRLRFA